MPTITGRQHYKQSGCSWCLIAFCIAVICLFATTESFAKNYSFSWKANPEPVEGYRLYYKKGGVKGPPFDGTGAIEGASPIVVGKQTSFTISGLDDNTTYYFALTAYNGADQSGYSEIITVFDIGTLAAVITSSSQEGEAPFSLTLNGSTSTGSISSYTWSFGDGQTATGATVSHIYQFPGTYTATLTVADLGGLTQQNGIVITASATATPPPATPPTVIISSSSAVGEAPFTVQLDGSDSTSTQPPLVSHAWDFGDGASGDGAVVAHTYTVAGTYHPALTVTDSAGLTNQTSTPILISAAPVQENKKPVASFTAAPTTGETPLNVSLNASGSSDPDGSISSYVWSFGDGSSGSGVSTQHTFTEIADYTVSLQVTDDKGATSVSSQTISVLAQVLYTDNESDGFWQWSRGNWKQISPTNPDNIVASGSLSYATTNTGGLWEWNGYNWRNINSVAPTNMVASGSVLYANFTGYGLYSWNGSAWTQLNPVNPDSMVASGSVLYANFTGYGLYSWNGSAWTQLNSVLPGNMVASGAVLYANFTGYGLYSWNGSAWTQLNSVLPGNMVASGAVLYANFTGYGLYSWNGSAWTQLSSVLPGNMVASGSVLYANFTGYGLYQWNGSAWTQLNSVLPGNMVASGSILYANYPTYGGVWKWEIGAWSFFSGAPATAPTHIVVGF